MPFVGEHVDHMEHQYVVGDGLLMAYLNNLKMFLSYHSLNTSPPLGPSSFYQFTV